MEVWIKDIEDAAEEAHTEVRICPDNKGVRVLSDMLSAAIEFAHELSLASGLEVADLADRAHVDNYGVLFPGIEVVQENPRTASASAYVDQHAIYGEWAERDR